MSSGTVVSLEQINKERPDEYLPDCGDLSAVERAAKWLHEDSPAFGMLEMSRIYRALCDRGIPVLNEKDVQDYKCNMVKAGGVYRDWEVVLSYAALAAFLWPLSLVSVGLLDAVGIISNRALCILFFATSFIVFICGAFVVGFLFAPKYNCLDWRICRLKEYSGAIPMVVLERIADLADALQCDAGNLLWVEALVERESSRWGELDPFLFINLPGMPRIYVAAWGENGFCLT